MQLPEGSDEIRGALIKLQKEVGLLKSRVEKLESDRDRKQSNYRSNLSLTNAERMANTSIRVIIGTAIIVVLTNWISAIVVAVRNL